MTPALFGSTLIRKAKEWHKCKQPDQDNNVPLGFLKDWRLNSLVIFNTLYYEGAKKIVNFLSIHKEPNELIFM